MHDGISIDGLLYKTIAVLGLVHEKIFNYYVRSFLKTPFDSPKYNKIHSSTLNLPNAGWNWGVALYDEMPICCRVRILFISDFEDL